MAISYQQGSLVSRKNRAVSKTKIFFLFKKKGKSRAIHIKFDEKVIVGPLKLTDLRCDSASLYPYARIFVRNRSAPTGRNSIGRRRIAHKTGRIVRRPILGVVLKVNKNFCMYIREKPFITIFRFISKNNLAERKLDVPPPAGSKLCVRTLGEYGRYKSERTQDVMVVISRRNGEVVYRNRMKKCFRKNVFISDKLRYIAAYIKGRIMAG